MLHHLLGHGARADNKRRASFEIPEDTLGKFYARQGDGHRSRADLGLRAHPLPHLERALECAIQQRPGRAIFERLTIGAAKLPQNFRLAQQHGIEPGGDAEEMAQCVRHRPAIDAAVDFRARDSVIRREKFFESFRDWRASLVGNAVQFAAIARREDDRFFQNSLPAKLSGGVQGLLLREGDALAQFNRSSAMVAADQDQVDTSAGAALRTAGRACPCVGGRGHQ